MSSVAEQFRKWIATEIESSAFDVCSRWAVKYRWMKGGLPYSLRRFPYVREIMDSQARFNWIKKSAQTGLSETAISIGLFTPIRLGRDVIYYFPTKAKMTEFSLSRVDDAIMLSPFISQRCSMRNRDLKRFGAASLFMLGANSATDLKSTSAARLIMDEFDEWPSRSVHLALERLSGQVDQDVRAWGFSTPKLPDIGIDAKFRESTQEYFFFHCPHCEQPIDLAWDEDREDFHCFVLNENDDPRTAYYRCWRCNRELPHEHKADWLSTGWYAAKTAESDPVEPDPELTRLSRGFHVPQMYSPGVTPEDFAIKYMRARSGDIDALREFYNSALGQPFLEDSHRVTDTHLRYAKAIEPFAMRDLGPIAQAEHYTTLGIDQGGPVHHWAVVSWKFDRERYGDPNDRAIGRLIGCGRIMADEWDRIYALMREYRIRMAVIDFYPQPTEARRFARRFQDFVYLCQYVNGTAGREVRTTEDEYGANLCKVDKVSWLSKSLGRIMAGDLLLPLDTPAELEEHVKAPIRTMHRDRQQAEYVIDAPDHYAHALNYAEIGLKILDPSLAESDAIIAA